MPESEHVIFHAALGFSSFFDDGVEPTGLDQLAGRHPASFFLRPWRHSHLAPNRQGFAPGQFATARKPPPLWAAVDPDFGTLGSYVNDYFCNGHIFRSAPPAYGACHAVRAGAS